MLLDKIYYQFSTFNYYIFEKISIVEIISILPNIVISVCAVITVFYARGGLSIWKKQFKAKIEYNLAHGILISVYKYRDAISFIRQRGITYNVSPKDEIQHSSMEKRIYSYECDYYENLYPSINDLKAKIYSNIFESEIHWNCDLRLLVDKLAGAENKIRLYFVDYLKLSDPNFGDGVYEDLLIEIRKKLFIKPGIEDDLSKEIAILIKDIEDFLRPKLELIIGPTFLGHSLKWLLACVGSIIIIAFVYIIFTK